MGEMRTENLAIAFVDIKGFTTRTSTQSREDNQKLLKRFEGVVRPVVRAFGGSVVKNIGDAYLLTYRSPTDALHSAMAMQDQLAELNSRLSGPEQFEIRLAVNVGEVRVENGDIFGEAVNIASRIEGLADGGEVWFSEAVYLVMNKSEVPYEDMGSKQLKGVPEPVRCFRIPRVAEIGEYRVKGSGKPKEAPQPEHPLEPPTLPYGGKALERVRSRLPDPERGDPSGLASIGSSLGAAHADAADEAKRMWNEGGTASKVLAPPAYVGKLAAGAVKTAASEQTRSAVTDAANRFARRFKEDSGFRYAVIGISILLVVLLFWAMRPRKSKMRRALDELGVSHLSTPHSNCKNLNCWRLASPEQSKRA